jgi:hypothetical protein
MILNSFCGRGGWLAYPTPCSGGAVLAANPHLENTRRLLNNWHCMYAKTKGSWSRVTEIAGSRPKPPQYHPLDAPPPQRSYPHVFSCRLRLIARRLHPSTREASGRIRTCYTDEKFHEILLAGPTCSHHDNVDILYSLFTQFDTMDAFLPKPVGI